MITIKHEGNTNTYYGLSTDSKPVGALNGSVFFEMDTKKVYMYDEDAASNNWKEI